MRVRVEIPILEPEARPFPASILPDDALRASIAERLHAHLRVADPCRLFKDASEACIRRERSLRKIAFGIPVQAMQLPVSAQAEWPAIAADVLAGNNAGQAAVTFGADFAIEFAASSSQAKP